MNTEPIIDFHVKGGIYLNGQFCPVTNLLNEFGDEVDSIKDAISAVAKFTADEWKFPNAEGVWIVFDPTRTGIFRVH